MRSDDLAPLLAPPAGPTVGFRQGVIREWNQATAENTVEVGGALLTNLPILNTSEALLLQPGDVVGIRTVGASWYIEGRITVPGTPAAASAMRAISDRMVTDVNVNFDSTSSSNWGDLASVGPQVTVTIGPSRKCLVLIGARFSGADLNAEMSFEVTGASSLAPVGYRAAAARIPATGVGVFTPARSVYLTNADGLQAGVNTFTAKYRAIAGTTALFTDRTMVVWPL